MSQENAFDPTTIDRPDPALLKYYMLCAMLSGPLSPATIIPLWFRYATLRYKFDDSGVSMSWGVFFKKEVYLTYRRIQDIHITRNILQRWMGLAKIKLQTASGSSQAEMAIEGILAPEQSLRHFLYGQMRGAKNENSNASTLHDASVTEHDRVSIALEGIHSALTKLVEQKNRAGESPC